MLEFEKFIFVFSLLLYVFLGFGSAAKTNDNYMVITHALTRWSFTRGQRVLTGAYFYRTCAARQPIRLEG